MGPPRLRTSNAARDVPGRAKSAVPVALVETPLLAQAVQDLGLTFRWKRMVVCPCRGGEAREEYARPTCPRCRGSGVWLVNPDARARPDLVGRDYSEVRAVFSSARTKADGTFETSPVPTGEGTLTVQSEMRVGTGDRFVGVEQEMVWCQLVRRGDSLDVPVGLLGRSTDDQITALAYSPVRVHLIADDSGTYAEGSDYVVSEERADVPSRITWLEGRGPDEGVLYAVHYTCRPVWVVDNGVFSVSSVRLPREGTRAGKRTARVLPTTFSVRLEHLTLREGT